MREDHSESNLSPSGWWETLFTTPLSDVIRGDWSSRYKQLLRSSALPPTIAERISRIVRKASLWRNERNDVTRELIAHFQEGLDRGVSAALLVEQFGDVKTTARLIRRAKLRKRPIWWKTWYGVSRTIAVLLAVLLVLYVVQAVRFFSGHAEITHNYFQEVDEEIRRTPVQDRAWPLYAETMKDAPKWPKGIEKAAEEGPRSNDWPTLVEFVHQNSDRIKLIEEASKKPALGWLPSEWIDGLRTIASTASPLLIISSSPVSDCLMSASRLLGLAINVAMVEGDSKSAQEYFITRVRIAEQLLNGEQSPLLLNQITGIAIFSRTSHDLERLLAKQSTFFSPDQISELVAVWSSFNKGVPFRASYKLERLLYLDVAQRVYTPGHRGFLCDDVWSALETSMPGNQSPTTKAFDWRGPIWMTVAVDRQTAIREAEAIQDEYTSIFAVRPWEWDERQEERLHEIDGRLSSRIAFIRNPLLLVVANNARLAKIAELAEVRRMTTLTALALTRYKLETGRWPQQLTELIPRYLPTAPIDPNDGKPIRYKLLDGNPLIYSVGSDRDDDGGTITPYQQSSGAFPDTFFSAASDIAKIHQDPKHEYHGDWLLWPPVEKKSE